MDRIKGLLLLVGVSLLVFFITKAVYEPDANTEQVKADVLLERIRPVLKLTTVEGDIVELFTHKDDADWGFSIPYVTEKRAILRVKAKVSVGYDLNGMRISTNELTHTITLEAPPEPMVLSVEHDVDYYDMDEGLFNSFAPHELTSISAKAKQKMVDQLPKSELFAEAQAQRDRMVEVVRALVETAGWKLELGWAPQGTPVLPVH